MTDIVDSANELMEKSVDSQLQEISALFDGQSLHECEMCGEKIPEARRKLGNVRLCVACKREQERL